MEECTNDRRLLQVREALCSGAEIEAALGECVWGDLEGLDIDLIKVSVFSSLPFHMKNTASKGKYMI